MAPRVSGKDAPISVELEKQQAEEAIGALAGWKRCKRCERYVEPYEIKSCGPLVDRCPECALNDLAIKISSVAGRAQYQLWAIPEWQKIARQLRRIIKERAERTT